MDRKGKYLNEEYKVALTQLVLQVEASLQGSNSSDLITALLYILKYKKKTMLL